MNNELNVSKNYHESDFEPVDCPRCHGTGFKSYWANSDNCPSCGGTGRTMQEGKRHVMGTDMNRKERDDSDVIRWLFQW